MLGFTCCQPLQFPTKILLKNRKKEICQKLKASQKSKMIQHKATKALTPRPLNRILCFCYDNPANIQQNFVEIRLHYVCLGYTFHRWPTQTVCVFVCWKY